MKLLAVGLVLLSACSPAAHRTALVSSDPNGFTSHVLSIPVQTCIPKNSQPVNSNEFVDWVNDGPPVRVTAACVWVGAASPGSTNLGGVVDIPIMLQNVTTGGIMDWESNDRYDTSYNRPLCQSWAPYGFDINTGDDVRFTAGCAGPYNGNQPVSVQLLAVLQSVPQ